VAVQNLRRKFLINHKLAATIHALNRIRSRFCPHCCGVNSDQIHRAFDVVLQMTVEEPNGTSLLPLGFMTPAKQKILSSRSFGQSVYHLDELK
jgi:hypothetical protein